MSWRLPHLLAIPAAAALVLGACTAAPTAPVTAPPTSAADLTPVLVSTLSSPRWFTGTDATRHLVYELLLTNVVPVPVTLDTIEVYDAGSDDVLARLTGDSLRAATSPAASPQTPATTLEPSAVAVVWMDVPLDERPVPAAIAHRVTTTPPSDAPASAIAWSFRTAGVEVETAPPAVLGPPLTGPGWAALGSCCDGPHRRALYPISGHWYLAQRFAIDFNQLDAQNRPGVGDPLSPNSFPTFGQPVHAVADGTVVDAADGNPDLEVGAPRAEPTPADAGGNRLVIDIGAGRFAVYAHLRRDSLAVRTGDTVTRGQPVAEVGSSGTGGPHLHFQLSDRPSVVLADGLPYVFDSFELTGQTPPLPEVLRYYDTLEPIPVSTGAAGPRRDALPLGRDVVAFPPVGGDR